MQSKGSISPSQLIGYNLTAIIDPGINDDFQAGYRNGSVWLNKSDTDFLKWKTFFCADATIGAAKWISFGSGGKLSPAYIIKLTGESVAYDTLQLAINAANYSETVIAFSDITETITPKDGVKININGFNLRPVSGSAIRHFNDSGDSIDITIFNINEIIISNGNNEAIYVSDKGDTSRLYLEFKKLETDFTFTSSAYGIYILCSKTHIECKTITIPYNSIYCVADYVDFKCEKTKLTNKGFYFAGYTALGWDSGNGSGDTPYINISGDFEGLATGIIPLFIFDRIKSLNFKGTIVCNRRVMNITPIPGESGNFIIDGDITLNVIEQAIYLYEYFNSPTKIIIKNSKMKGATTFLHVQSVNGTSGNPSVTEIFLDKVVMVNNFNQPITFASTVGILPCKLNIIGFFSSVANPTLLVNYGSVSVLPGMINY